MIQEQELEETYGNQETLLLKELFNQYKDTWEIEQFDEHIANIKKLIPKNFTKIVYDYCKEHGFNELIRTAKQLRSRLQKKDSHICIEGETGSGKSTLTLVLFCLVAHLTKQKFDLESNVLYLPKPNELSGRLKSLKEYELLMVDETIKSLNKLKFYNADAIESNELVQTERFRHNTVIYCVPSFDEITKSFRQVNIKFRIWCYDTKQAFFRVKETDPDIKHIFGAWHTPYRAKYKVNKRINSMTDIATRRKVEEALPGHISSFNWPDMENIPELAAFHLLYEVSKKKSRKVVEIADAEQADIPQNVNDRKAYHSLKFNIHAELKKDSTLTPTKYIKYQEDLVGSKYPYTRGSIQRMFSAVRKELIAAEINSEKDNPDDNKVYNNYNKASRPTVKSAV